MSRQPLPTIILPPGRWGEIEQIERDEFRDIMPPNLRQTTFLAALADDGSGDIAGHLRIEVLHHLVHVHTRPDFRNHAAIARQLMLEAAECIPIGFSGIWLARKPYPQLAAMLGATELKDGPFHVYRRDN